MKIQKYKNIKLYKYKNKKVSKYKNIELIILYRLPLCFRSPPMRRHLLHCHHMHNIAFGLFHIQVKGKLCCMCCFCRNCWQSENCQ